MAGLPVSYYRNYDANDTVSVKGAHPAGQPLVDIESLGWVPEDGMRFREWNSARDGSGTGFQPGDYDTMDFGDHYAIWEEIPEEIPYLTTSLELASVADAIRARGGTSASLVYPSGFVSAIAAIPGGGGGGAEDGIIARTVSGVYENSTVGTVGSYAFYSCVSLTSVSFPACSAVGNYAFAGCTGLISAAFASCRSVSAAAFSGCTKLSGVSFPECTSMAASAFYNCQKLSQAAFPKCLSVGTSAFYSCWSMSAASFPLCTSIASYAFCNCSALASASFPMVRVIGVSAFTNCRALSVLNLPACTSISSNAFARCFGLVSLYLTGASVVSLPYSNAFSSTPIGGYSAVAGRFGSIYVPSSLLATYQSKAGWSFYSSRFAGV